MQSAKHISMFAALLMMADEESIRRAHPQPGHLGSKPRRNDARGKRKKKIAKMSRRANRST